MFRIPERLIRWFETMLSENNEASASRFVMVLASVVILFTFSFSVIYTTIKTGAMPDTSSWAYVLSLGLGGGSTGYISGKIMSKLGNNGNSDKKDNSSNG